MLLFVALLCATFSVSYAQLQISLDLGGSIANSAATNFGANSPQAKLAVAYSRFIPDAHLGTDSAGNIVIQNPSGTIQSAMISQTEALSVTGSMGISQTVVFNMGQSQTITATTLEGSKISYTVSLGADGRYKVTFDITVKLNVYNIVIQTNQTSISFPITPDMVRTTSQQPPPPTNVTPPTTTSTSGSSGSGGYTVPTGATSPGGSNAYFWQTYQGPGSDYYAVTSGSGTVVFGPLIVISQWE